MKTNVVSERVWQTLRESSDLCLQVNIILAAIGISILSDLSEAVMHINSLNLHHNLCDILQCVDVHF